MEEILIIDFGSQYTQLIAKKIRKCRVYSKVSIYTNIPTDLTNIKGVILSGSPHSVVNNTFPSVDLSLFDGIPVLGICYGAQVIAKNVGETVNESQNREFGQHTITLNRKLLGVTNNTFTVWMSHNDTIMSHKNINVLAKTENDAIAAFQVKNKLVFGLQFHPEVSHTTFGDKMISSFVKLCNVKDTFTMDSYTTTIIKDIREKVRNGKVIMAVSGGVDSTVTACLLHRAIGSRLQCVFVDNGLLRKDEVTQVESILDSMELHATTIDASQEFYTALKGVSDPEQKRKIIGATFINVFQEYAQEKCLRSRAHLPVNWLGQGTIYPDVIESVPGFGLIKSHHNVGGLPDNMHLKLIEPIRMLFKDEVREIGTELGIPKEFINRHPFPGPGLGIRIMGNITQEKVKILQEADAIFINELEKNKMYNKIWQAGVVLLSVKTVGVMGDTRTYEYTAALRAVCSENGMTARPYNFNTDFLIELSTKIINNVKGINRVVYDISSKPPATIEWE